MLKTRSLIAAAIIGLAAHAATPTTAAAEGTIPVIVKNTSTYYWRVLLAGARKAGDELGIEIAELGPQTDSDINGQISVLENAVANNPLAVVIAASQYEALGKPIDEAATKTIVVGVDSGANSDAYASFVTTNNVEGGRAAGEALAAAIAKAHGDAEGDVMLITSVPGAESLDQRAEGFKAVLADKYPKIRIVADKVADGQIVTGLNIANDVILANPKLRGIFASSEKMAVAVSQAVAENNLQDQIKIVAFDSNEQLVQHLADGIVAALIIQDPMRMGYDGVKIAYAASKGEKVPEMVDTGVNVITQENMGSERSQELLNPKID
ncbi:substrate-binding domain-containing protein [Nitratireductor sp. CAU 1489]|uniref:Substrate-binding domain-containing protein n=1 Tax=Nitratireductor arenosus TaxID=2682096 RepID=A0A844QAP3_9HYPH|nr:substrate-binding domain-containing protein [Nitratireductor arenosus]MVA95997.1 substrate-binding domain-containing protein [Nitratireductor arenosus]